jgi:hypothetical protein
MKINNQHLEALRQVQEQSSKTGAAKTSGMEDFAKALAQELVAAETAGVDAGVTRQVSLGELATGMGVSLPTTAANVDADATEAMVQLSGLLDGFGAYAQILGSGGEQNLKAAYAALEQLSGTVTALRSSLFDVAAKHPGLNDVLNELEVLAHTEQFKFNRGDYL